MLKRIYNSFNKSHVEVRIESQSQLYLFFDLKGDLKSQSSMTKSVLGVIELKQNEGESKKFWSLL